MKTQQVNIEAIELDTTIQCRASLDMHTINDYAERMRAGDEFPPVVLFVERGRFWIGDGWHRIMAAQSVDLAEIAAEARTGGRAEALKFALGANGTNGLRRSNADKRRAVEIALKEFSKLSSNAIAELCGVSDFLVNSVRPEQLLDSRSSTRVGKDGKARPARRKQSTATAPDGGDNSADNDEGEEKCDGNKTTAVAPGPPCDGMYYAKSAVGELKRIKKNDTQREMAFAYVREWLDKNDPARPRADGASA